VAATEAFGAEALFAAVVLLAVDALLLDCGDVEDERDVSLEE
jgi:hypothetical protein